MSLSALLFATRNWVRAELQLDESECDIRPGPEPPAACGQRYLSVYPRIWRPGDFDLNLGIDEYYDLAIAVTYRVGYSPDDKRGESPFLEALEGMEAVIRKLLPIHKNIDIMEAANARFSGSNKIFEPLRWKGNDAAPTPVGAQWFHADDEGEGDPVAGHVMEANFGDARRKLTLSNLVGGT